MNGQYLALLAGLGQDMVAPAAVRARASSASRREIAIPSYHSTSYARASRVRGGFGDAIDAGDYHIVGTQVILRAQPDASSAEIGVLENGEGVYAFGDVTTDPSHMVGQNGVAIPNDGNSPGIDYVHVGTQTHGPGWVAKNFIAAGAGGAVQQPIPSPQPKPSPAPVPAPAPATTTTTPPSKSYVMPVLVGGAIGVVVLGGLVLLARHAAKSHPRQLAHA